MPRALPLLLSVIALLAGSAAQVCGRPMAVLLVTPVIFVLVKQRALRRGTLRPSDMASDLL